jgi:hypothetical protein
LRARLISGRGKIADAGRCDIVHRLRDHAILKHRLSKIDDVVDNDVFKIAL